MNKIYHGFCKLSKNSVTTYPFNLFGGLWRENTPDYLSQLPFKGDIVIGNDVWIGRESVIMPGVRIGIGSIVGAYSVVTKDIPPYSVVGENPAKLIRKRFNDELIEILLELKWWDYDAEKLVSILPWLCESDLTKAQELLKQRL